MSADDARDQLSRDQAALVAALGHRGDVPSGFDADRVRLAADTLDNKRRKGVAKAWPSVAASLGAGFTETFATFAAGNPPHPDGPAADGNAFATWLDARRRLPSDAVPELLAAQLRRGFPLGFRLRRSGGRFVVGVRFPLLGVRVFARGAASR